MKTKISSVLITCLAILTLSSCVGPSPKSITLDDGLLQLRKSLQNIKAIGIKDKENNVGFAATEAIAVFNITFSDKGTLGISGVPYISLSGEAAASKGNTLTIRLQNLDALDPTIADRLKKGGKVFFVR